MLRSVLLARMPALADRGVLGRQAERVVAHRPQDAEAAPAAEVGDDVADRVVEDVPHVQLARGVRQHLEHVRLARPSALAGLGVRRRRRPARPPRRAATSASISLGSYRSSSLVSGYKKASRWRGRGKLRAASPRSLPALRKKLLHCANASTVPSPEPAVAAGVLRARRAARDRARGALRDAARRLLASRRCASARGCSGEPRRTRSSSTGRRRSRTSRCCGCSPRRGSAPTSRRSASSRSRCAPGIAGERLVVPRQQQVRRGAARAPPRRARSSSSTRSTRPRARRRPACDACSSASRPGVEAETHEAIRTGHRGSKFGLDADDALEAIAARARRRARRRRACTSTSARSSPTRGAHLLAVELARRVRGRAAATSSAGRRRSSTSAAASAIRHVARRAEPPLEEFVRARRRAVARDVGGARAAGAAADPRAGPLARRAGRRSRSTASASVKRAGDATRTSRSTAACPTTRARSSTARATRRCSRTGPTRSRDGDVHDRRQALRVGRRADRARRAAGAPARRPARGPGDRRVHARDGSNYNGVPRRRPCSSRTARRG